MAGRGMRKKKRDAHGLPLTASPTGIDTIQKPPHIAADAVASAIFDAVVGHLAERGDLRPSFELPIALLATEWARYLVAVAIAAKEPVIEGSRGLRANPACAVAAAAARTVQTLCAEFAFSPASLARVDLPAAAVPQGASVIEAFRLRRKTTVDLDDPDVEGLDKFFLQHGDEDQRRDAEAAVLRARRSGR